MQTRRLKNTAQSSAAVPNQINENKESTYMKKLTLVSVLAFVLSIAPSLVQAGVGNAGNPGILPSGSSAHGQTYGAWSDAWWQWALSIPADTNPMLDPTGANAAIGQSGSVWFLAGNQGGTSERSVTIPPGKTLFLPLVNYVWINTPQFGDPEWSPEQEAFARALIAAAIDTANGLACEIDGKSVKNLMAYRCQTPPGGAEMIALPEGNIFGIPADTYGPMVTDGYYLMVTPLTPGEHTLHFKASLGDNFHVDVTYHLTVKR